jgi:hypothetical protein
MADRFPLVANSSTSQIQEIPNGDTLDLSGNNVKGVGIITATTFSGNVTSSGANTLGSLTVSNDATVQGNLTVNGTTTTIDTAVTSVDTLQVDGNVAIGTDTTYTNNSFTTLSVGGNAKFGLLELKKSDGVAGSWIDCYGTGGNGDLRITTAGTSGAITFWTGGSFTENVRITSGGNVGIGTDNPGAKTHIDSVTSNTPLVVEASQNNRSRIVFRNNVETGTECNIELFDDDLRFTTNSGERLRIGSDGEIGLSGANYGTVGQVLTSQGSGSAPQWASAASSMSVGTRYTNPNTTSVEWTSLPANIQALDVGYADAYAGTNNAENERLALRLGTSGGYVTSNYTNRSWNLYSGGNGHGFSTTKSAFIPYYWIDNTDRATTMFTLRRMGTTNTFQAQWHEYIAGGHNYVAMGGGYVNLGAELTQIRIQTINNTSAINGSFWMNYTTR